MGNPQNLRIYVNFVLMNVAKYLTFDIQEVSVEDKEQVWYGLGTRVQDTVQVWHIIPVTGSSSKQTTSNNYQNASHGPTSSKVDT